MAQEVVQCLAFVTVVMNFGFRKSTEFLTSCIVVGFVSKALHIGVSELC